MEESITAEILKKVKSKLYTYISVLIAIIIVLVGCIWFIFGRSNKNTNISNKNDSNIVEPTPTNVLDSE